MYILEEFSLFLRRNNEWWLPCFPAPSGMIRAGKRILLNGTKWLTPPFNIETEAGRGSTGENDLPQSPGSSPTPATPPDSSVCILVTSFPLPPFAFISPFLKSLLSSVIVSSSAYLTLTVQGSLSTSLLETETLESPLTLPSALSWNPDTCLPACLPISTLAPRPPHLPGFCRLLLTSLPSCLPEIQTPHCWPYFLSGIVRGLQDLDSRRLASWMFKLHFKLWLHLPPLASVCIRIRKAFAESRRPCYAWGSHYVWRRFAGRL